RSPRQGLPRSHSDRGREPASVPECSLRAAGPPLLFGLRLWASVRRQSFSCRAPSRILPPTEGVGRDRYQLVLRPDNQPMGCLLAGLGAVCDERNPSRTPLPHSSRGVSPGAVSGSAPAGIPDAGRRLCLRALAPALP